MAGHRPRHRYPAGTQKEPAQHLPGSGILINGFKEQVVASSIVAAVRYKYKLEIAIKNKIEELTALPEDEINAELLEKLRFLKVAAIVSGVQNEESYIRKARNDAQTLDAVNSFKKDFDFSKPESGVGIIYVCDRLLTGFDSPVEQVMYLGKSLREHNLFQAITRVNRTKCGKTFGLIVDYFGVTKHLTDALAIYIDKEIPILEARYKRLLDLFGWRQCAERNCTFFTAKI